ncbi:MAG: hypothetical protein JSR84_12605 [Proteobacteria bacterium]|nr:hypothetical protein [Pseudomonadota bacterium]
MTQAMLDLERPGEALAAAAAPAAAAPVARAVPAAAAAKLPLASAADSAAPAAASAAPTDWRAALVLAQQAEAAPDGLAAGRDAAAWWRLALLRSFVTPLAHGEAARLPLRVLPPPGLKPVNPVQALQAALTLALARRGGVARLQPLGARLPAAQRLALHLFVNALLPRLIEQGAGAAVLPAAALEAAWADARVNRRWQAFALALDADAAATLLPALPRRAAAPRAAARATIRAPSQERCRWPSTSSMNMRRSSAPAPGSPKARP